MRNIESLNKSVKSLVNQNQRRIDLDDRRIKKHIAKALDDYEEDIGERLANILNEVKNMQEPIHAKFIDMSSASEGLQRSNLRFMQLYRQCLIELQTEIKEKKSVLDTAQLAFLTADPGLVQQKISSYTNNYKK